LNRTRTCKCTQMRTIAPTTGVRVEAGPKEFVLDRHRLRQTIEDKVEVRFAYYRDVKGPGTFIQHVRSLFIQSLHFVLCYIDLHAKG